MPSEQEREDARELVADALRRHLLPPPEITVDEWAEKYRHLEKRVAAEGGPWRNVRVPYLVEPQRMLTDPRVRDVSMMKGAQTGGTEIGVNWFCQQIETDPGPLLWVTSNEEQVKKVSRRRFDPMLDREPLVARVSPRRGRNADRSTQQISFDQGSLGIVTHASPAALSSDPQWRVVCDETDRWDESSGKEGDPWDMIRSRQSTFEDFGAKTYSVSTPGIEGSSRIAALYEKSDQRRYHVPCPECGTLQELVWFGQRDDGHKYGVMWDKSVPKIEAPKTAYYQCEHCPARWTDAQRWAATAIEAGACWVPTRPFNGHVGYYVPALLSSFVRLAPCVERWLNAQGKPAQLQTFWNLVMGLPWSLTAEKAPASIPTELWEGFDVPSSACLLVGFADVQGDRFEVSIVGVGPDETLYAVEHRILQGNTQHPDVWDELSLLLTRKWRRSDGKQIALSAFGIDTSYLWERVCDWAAQQDTVRCYPIRGVGRGITEPIIRERVPSHAKGGRLFYNSNVDASKLAVIQKLQLRAGPGRIRFPIRGCFSDAYFGQFRSESLKRRYVRGYSVLEWHLKASARNEALDCMAGVLAVIGWLNPALDVLVERNPKVTDAPPELPPLTAENAEAVADAIVERVRAMREGPSAPVQVGPQIVRRHSGAWYEGGGPRRGRY